MIKKLAAGATTEAHASKTEICSDELFKKFYHTDLLCLFVCVCVLLLTYYFSRFYLYIIYIGINLLCQ